MRILRKYALLMVACVALLYLGYHLFGFKSPARTARYNVSFDLVDTMPVSVSSRFDCSHIDTLYLRSVIQSEARPFEMLGAFADDGARLPVRTWKREVEHNESVFHFDHVAVATGRAAVAQVTYRCALGCEEGDEHESGLSGAVSGGTGSSWVVASLAHLIVVPDSSSAVHGIDIEYDLPAGWKIYSAVADGGLPGEGSDVDIGELFLTPLVFGANTLPRFADAPLRAISIGLDADGASRAFNETSTIYRESARFLGLDPSDPYLVVFAEPDERGFEMFVESTRYGSVVTRQGATLVHRRATIQQIFERHLEELALSAKLTRPGDEWFASALASYGTNVLMSRLYGAEDAGAFDDLKQLYVGLLENGDIVLASQADSRNAISTKGAAVLALMDGRIREETGGRRTLGHAIRAITGSGAITSLQDAIEKATGVDLQGEFDRYVYSRDILPYETHRVADHRMVAPPAITDSVALVVTYDGKSFLEHCGCKANQLGGIARAGTWLKNLRARFDGPTFFVSIGNTFPQDRQNIVLNDITSAELDLYLSLMGDIGYGCAIVAETELYYGHQVYSEKALCATFPFVSANVHRNGQPIAKPFHVMDDRDRSLAVVGITPRSRHYFYGRAWEARNTDLSFDPPLKAVGRALDAIAGPRPDLRVVAGRIGTGDIRRIARGLDDVDVIVSYDATCLCTDGENILTADRNGFVGECLVLYPNAASYGISAYILFLDADGHIAGYRDRTAMLTEDIPDDPAVRTRIDRFYIEAAGDYEDRGDHALGIWGNNIASGNTYVGAETCAACHPDERAQWGETSHSSAFKTLLGRHRQYNPACVKCHVTGFEQHSGYVFGDMTSPMRNVQCEVCHGPGYEHASSGDIDAIDRSPPPSLCIACHNTEHSDMTEANFRDYLAKVSH